jgi:glycosyltransferase involved in cell wall biosynthesis
VRVLITVGGYGSGSAPRAALAGAELMALRTGEALAELGHEVGLLTDDATLPVPGALTALPWQRQQAGQWDVVHAFDLARPSGVHRGLSVARQLGVPFALTPSSAREVWPDPALAAEACAAAQRVFALTPVEAADLPLSDPAVLRLIGQGPSLADDPDPSALRRRLPGTGPVVLFLGRRGRLKGLDVLRAAAPLVWQAVPDAIFAVAGPPHHDDETHPDPRFVDLGAADLATKTGAIAACAVLCLPSRADVFPLVFVEAWTLGKPVVSGDFRGAADVVRDGVDGLVCAVRPDAVADALCTLLRDEPLRARLGAAGRNRARRELSWAAVATAVESALREIPAVQGGVR